METNKNLKMDTGLSLNAYQQEASKYGVYETDHYPFYGLAEEVGELLGLVAKAERGDDMVKRYGSSEAFRDAIIKELGDILWQLQEICTIIKVPLEYVARTNLDKLKNRKSRGVIKGAGDDR